MRALSDGLAAKLRRDYEGACACWEPIADEGDPQALYYLANLYHDELDNKLQAALVAERLMLAAGANDHRAQYYLGLLYQYGRGVERDFQCALDWLTRAADGGELQARQRLGHMYRNGCGVARNDMIGGEWLRRADTVFGYDEAHHRDAAE